MQTDRENFLRLEGKSFRPLFRIFFWDRLCVSYGFLQKTPRVNLPYVKRPTGGGLLLHGWDMSFSIVDIKERWGKSAEDVYSKLTDLLMTALKNLGVKAELGTPKKIDKNLCYFYPTPWEIEVEGKKLISFSMRSGRKAFLIQGTVYLRFDHIIASHLLKLQQSYLKDRVLSLKDLGVEPEAMIKELMDTFSSL